MNIYFIRHGESVANVKRIISNRGNKHPLTELGQQQARDLASKLQPEKPVRFFCSPILRARQTAKILADSWGVNTVDVRKELREYDLGELEDRSDAKAWGLYDWEMDEWFKHNRLNVKVKGGESWLDIHDRFVPFIQSLVQLYGDQEGSLICLSHGGLYRVMLPQVVSNLPVKYALENPLSKTGVIRAVIQDRKINILQYQDQIFDLNGPVN